jgi:hypothetical protein
MSDLSDCFGAFMKKYKKPTIKKHGELRSITFSNDTNGDDVPERPPSRNTKVVREKRKYDYKKYS